MTDISKCSNAKCKLRSKCWRWNAPTDERWQAYADFEGGKKCSGYWEMSKTARRLVKTGCKAEYR